MIVVDLCGDVAGRFAAKLFAMAGARVVRARPDAGDPAPGGDLLSAYLDAHKAIADPADVEDLLGQADLVFTSFDGGRFHGRAASPLPLSKACVQVTTSTFGRTGPYAGFRGGPLADWAAGGYLAITGEPEREPLIGPETLCGYAGGYTAALAAEAALFERQRTGVGRHLDMSTMEAMLQVHQSTFSRFAAGIVRQRTGRYYELYPLTMRPCRKGVVMLSVFSEEDFDRLMLAMGRPELSADPRFATQEARMLNRDALDLEMDAYLSQHEAEEVERVLVEDFDLPVVKVAGAGDITDNPQLADRRYWEAPAGLPGGLMPGNPVPAPTVFAEPSRSPAAPKRRAASPDQADQPPLSGVVVLDLTQWWAGPSATRHLADLGAEVTWLERPNARIDQDPHSEDPLEIVAHLYQCKLSRNKRSVVLDLRHETGRAAARAMALRADVLVENYRPGVLAKIGLGPKALCRANPDLVYVSLSGYGGRGPWSGRRSFGPTVEAASSVIGRTGYLGGGPLRLGHPLPDGVGGIVGALTAIRGLRERAARGCGGWYDLSQLEAYVAMSGEDILAASRGLDRSRIGNRSRYGAVQGAFPCLGENQWIAIRLVDAGDFERFVAVTGYAGPRPRFGETAQEIAGVEAAIADVTRQREKFELTLVLQEVGLEAFPALNPTDLVADPHLQARGFLVRPPAAGRSCVLPGSPLGASFPLADLEGPPPLVGEHTAEVLAELAALVGDQASSSLSPLGK